MYCSKCGTQNEENAQFCKACGAKLATTPYEMQPDTTMTAYKDDVEYAGFWIRVGAYLLDGVILIIPVIILNLFLNFVLGMSEEGASNLTSFLGLIYVAAFESSKFQATPGKMVVGVKVVGEHQNRISFWRALWRNFAMFFSTIILFIGYMMVGWTKKKQGLHDFMAQTYVVRKY